MSSTGKTTASGSRGSGPPRTAAAQSKGKRKATRSPPSQRPRTRKRAKKGPAPHAGNPHKLREADVPEKAVTLKDSLFLHIRILWGLFRASDIPQAVPADVLTRFAQRFTTPEEMVTVLQTGVPPSDIDDRIRAVRQYAQTAHGSNTSAQIAFIDDQHLATMFTAVQAATIAKWNPDLSSSADSLYNVCLEVIAIHTFKQVCALDCYAWMKPDNTFLNNTLLLRRFYRHFVFFYQAQNVKLETKQAGAVAARLSQTIVYERRDKLSANRKAFLKSQGLPKHVQELFGQGACSSDDEEEPVALLPHIAPRNKRYFIKDLPQRSPIVTEYARALDRTRDEALAQRPGKRQHPPSRERIVPDEPVQTLLTRLPGPKCPLDWIHHEVFNNLPVSVRAQYINSPVIFPTTEALTPMQQNGVVPVSAIKALFMLPRAAFMEQYGTAKRALYDFPTEEEMANAEAESTEEEGEE